MKRNDLKQKHTEKGKRTMKIKIKYHADINRIEKYQNGDWIDLRAAEDVFLYKGDLRNIRLGVSMELPSGYEAIVAPRSSTPRNFGIICANSIGIIDESYCGDNDEWMFPAYAIRDTQIHKNDRICQFRLLEHQKWAEFYEVEHLEGTNRGGFGSTGRN